MKLFSNVSTVTQATFNLEPVNKPGYASDSDRMLPRRKRVCKKRKALYFGSWSIQNFINLAVYPCHEDKRIQGWCARHCLKKKTSRLPQFSSQMSTDCFRGLLRTKHAQINPEQCPVFPPFHRKQPLQVSVHLFSSLPAEPKGCKHPEPTLPFKPPTVKRTRKISFPS